MASKRSMISQLASVGEGALGRLAQNPVTHKAVEGALQLKDRVEKLVSGVEELQERVARLEQRVDELEHAKRPRTTKKTADGDA